jgi:hypothetical protein
MTGSKEPHIRGDGLLLDVVRLVYGTVMVNEQASDPDGIDHLLDLWPGNSTQAATPESRDAS